MTTTTLLCYSLETISSDFVVVPLYDIHHSWWWSWAKKVRVWVLHSLDWNCMSYWLILLELLTVPCHVVICVKSLSSDHMTFVTVPRSSPHILFANARRFMHLVMKYFLAMHPFTRLSSYCKQCWPVLSKDVGISFLQLRCWNGKEFSNSTWWSS